MVSLEQKDGIFVLNLPLAFTPDNIIETHGLLDQVEGFQGPTALIVTNKNPKIFSAGLDLKFITKTSFSSGMKLSVELTKLTSRMMSLSVPSIAAINGHAVTAGLFVALALDYRVMTKDQGTLSINEVNMGMIIPRGASMILSKKLQPAVIRDLVLRGRVYGPQEALEDGIADFLAPGNQLMIKAREIAAEVMKFGEKKAVYKQLKVSSYLHEIAELSNPKYRPDFIEAIKGSSFPKL